MKGSVNGLNPTVSFTAPPSPTISIIVVAWRSAPFLLDCLRAVATNVADVNYEVIVVLNEPTPELEARLVALVDGVIVVRTRVNIGFAGAVNLGAAEANGEHVMLLNDDAEVLPGWLEALVETAERHPDVGAVGSKVLFSDGTVQEIGGVIWSDGSATNVGRGLPGDTLRYDFERRVDYCSGCSLLVRRSTWLEIGGLDEEYFPAYYEDVDLCFRIQATGRSVWVQPRSRVTHRLSASTGGSYRSFLLEHNRRRFCDRWSEALDDRGSPALGDPLAVDRAVWRGIGAPVGVLAILGDELAGSAALSAIGRLQTAALAALGGGEIQLTVVAGTAFDAHDREKSDEHLVVESLKQHFERIGAPYALVGVAVRAVGYEAIARSVHETLPDVPIILDAEVLRADVFVLEEAREAELSAAADVDYLVCSDPEIAEALGRSPVPVETLGHLHIYAPALSPSTAAAVHRSESVGTTGRAGPSLERWPSPARDDLGLLTPSELKAVARELALKDDYARHLEGEVRELTDDVALRDAYVERTEAYADELRTQIEQLANEIEEKNLYIREKEADIVRLFAELGKPLKGPADS